MPLSTKSITYDVVPLDKDTVLRSVIPNNRQPQNWAAALQARPPFKMVRSLMTCRYSNVHQIASISKGLLQARVGCLPCVPHPNTSSHLELQEP